MPKFSERPAVFPPVVPEVPTRGDMPIYAFADGPVVLAWTPPDEFRPRTHGRFCFSRGPGRLLSIDVDLFCGDDPTGRQTFAEREARKALERCHSVQRYLKVDPMDVQEELVPYAERDARGYILRDAYDMVLDTEGKRDRLTHEMAFLAYETTSDETVLFTLRAEHARHVRGAPDPDDPIEEALALWRGAILARGPMSPIETYASWRCNAGFMLASRLPGGSGQVDGRYVEGGPHRLGGEAHAEVSRPSLLDELAIEGDVAEDLRLAKVRAADAKSIDVTTREIRCAGVELRVLGGYEIVAEEQAESIEELSLEEEPNPENEPVDEELAEFERNERIARFNPGLTTRVAYFAIDEDHFTRLRVEVGGHLSGQLEGWWEQACTRLWVWSDRWSR